MNITSVKLSLFAFALFCEFKGSAGRGNGSYASTLHNLDSAVLTMEMEAFAPED